MRRIKTLLGVVALSLSGSAIADTILYTIEDLGDGRWQYNYTLENTGTNALEEFEIYFDLGLYEALSLEGTASGWFSEVLQPDPALPDDGFLLSYLDTGPTPILPGEILSGWSVSFDYLIGGTPGEQTFVFYSGFDVISEGLTQRDAASVPEPATIGLLATSLMLLLMMRRRQPARLERATP